MNVVRRPVKWSRGNFFFQVTHSHDIDSRDILTVVPLASMIPFGGADATDQRMSQAMRGLRVGGVKFTAQRRLAGFAQDVQLTPDDWRDTVLRNVDTKLLLISDTMVIDSATGAESPQALNTNWFTNTLPAASTPEVQDEDVQFPRRIHWQDYRNLDASLDSWQDFGISGGEDPSQHVYLKSQQTVTPNVTGANLKLRLRLQDDEALCWHFASHCQQVLTAENLEPEIDFRVTGTIWYKYDW